VFAVANDSCTHTCPCAFPASGCKRRNWTAMGNFLKGLFKGKEMRILMLGLDAAGKTSMLTLRFHLRALLPLRVLLKQSQMHARTHSRKHFLSHARKHATALPVVHKHWLTTPPPWFVQCSRCSGYLQPSCTG
jgi:hypothetical protein